MPIFNFNLKESFVLPELNDTYPKDITTIASGSTSFEVSFSSQGYPAEYTYQWYVDGAVVDNANNATYVRDISSDTGTHSIYCTVKNKAGTVTSRVATLTIQHVLTVTSNKGASITATNSEGNSVSGTCNDSGVANLTLNSGAWTITATSSSVSNSTSVIMDSNKSLPLIANMVPAFDYSGSYEILNDDNSATTASSGNWKIRFLTSGTLTITELNGAADGIDVFCVGGGGKGGGGGSCGEDNITQGGGGGGGYTKTSKDINVSANSNYSITIGSTGSKSSGFGVEASGGSGGGYTGWGGFAECAGGNGGSGGGATGKSGGTNGGDGGSGSITSGGKGQGTTTREFGESSGRLYASGGKGGGGAAGAANTGNGGGGKYGGGGAGGSGIVVIRNKR